MLFSHNNHVNSNQISLYVFEGNLDKSLQQFNSHDPLLLAADVELTQGRDEIPQIIDCISVLRVGAILSGCFDS